MVRRTKTAALETREQILDAAEWCFRTMGASGTTLDMIADIAKCTRGAIYWHFPDSVDILDAVLERGQWPLLERLEAVTHLRCGVLAALHDCLDNSLRDALTNVHMRQSLEILVYRCDFAGERTKLLELQRQKLACMQELLRAVLERAQQCGELCDDLHCPSAAALIGYALVGALRVHLIKADDDALVRSALPALEIALASIGCSDGILRQTTSSNW